MFPKAGSVEEAALSCRHGPFFLGSTSTVRPSATTREVEASESAARGVQEQAKSRLRCEPERDLNENFCGTRGWPPATRAEAWTGPGHLVRRRDSLRAQGAEAKQSSPKRVVCSLPPEQLRVSHGARRLLNGSQKTAEVLKATPRASAA